MGTGMIAFFSEFLFCQHLVMSCAEIRCPFFDRRNSNGARLPASLICECGGDASARARGAGAVLVFFYTSDEM